MTEKTVTENEATHTPGPWRCSVQGGRHAIENAGQTLLHESADGHDYIDFTDADWRLIAAAPDLLALLVELRDSHFGAAVRVEYEDRVEAAIAKAEGRAS